MHKKVGIPRGLFYYKYFPLWKCFLEELGAEIMVSEETNKSVVDTGVSICADDACLPVKVFCGHAAQLAGKVDYLFIPRFTSISRNEYVCPEFGGIPDLVRHTVEGAPVVIDTEVNLRKEKKNSLKAAIEAAEYFSIGRSEAEKAYVKAVRAYKEFIKNMTLDVYCQKPGDFDLNIVVVGHSYIVSDRYINMDLIGKLNKLGANVITVETAPDNAFDFEAAGLKKPVFWYFARKALSGAFYYLKKFRIDGMIYVMSFGCGIDSFVCDLLQRRVRKECQIPFVLITLDEHTGEAGLNTRLEAFIDMIRWNRKNESNFSTSRKRLCCR